MSIGHVAFATAAKDAALAAMERAEQCAAPLDSGLEGTDAPAPGASLDEVMGALAEVAPAARARGRGPPPPSLHRPPFCSHLGTSGFTCPARGSRRSWTGAPTWRRRGSPPPPPSY